MTDLILSPRDGMFLKDGREWASTDAGRAHSLEWPMPSTLHGALCTAAGRMVEAGRKPLTKDDWLKLSANIRIDALLALRRRLGSLSNWVAADRAWPVPADALFLSEPKDQLRRLDPHKPLHTTLGRHDDDSSEKLLWWPRIEEVAKPAPAPKWWTEAALLGWLTDQAEKRQVFQPAGPGSRAAKPGSLDYRGLALARHVQVHVGIDPDTQAAREQILFAHDVVETLDEQRYEWTIGCRVTMPGKLLTGCLTLGGDRRVAGIASAPAALFNCPTQLSGAFAARRPKGLRLVAVTPAAFNAGWLPDGLSPANGAYRGKLKGVTGELILRAAFVSRATHVSGWDMARGDKPGGQPKPTTRLVPPGTVYYFAKHNSGAFSAEEAKALWFIALGDRTEHGFGRFIPGVWEPKES
ncbi:MAG TPA: type III-B CRISPR module-associated Cmr3 family protein [Acetobacteraceae bacterium]|nr:type III-B CRISPR module-associated Cmr3 family protein [Acetobacteraceae bacterium]